MPLRALCGQQDHSEDDHPTAGEGQQRWLLRVRDPDPERPENGLQQRDEGGFRGRDQPGADGEQCETEGYLTAAEQHEQAQIVRGDSHGLGECAEHEQVEDL